MMVLTFVTPEAETGEWVVSGKPGLHGEFKASLSYTENTCLKKRKNEKKSSPKMMIL